MDILQQALLFCAEKNIRTYPKVIGYDQMKVVINDNGQEKIGEKIYSNKEFCKKQQELIIEIYKKHLTLQKK